MSSMSRFLKLQCAGDVLNVVGAVRPGAIERAMWYHSRLRRSLCTSEGHIVVMGKYAFVTAILLAHTIKSKRFTVFTEAVAPSSASAVHNLACVQYGREELEGTNWDDWFSDKAGIAIVDDYPVVEDMMLDTFMQVPALRQIYILPSKRAGEHASGLPPVGANDILYEQQAGEYRNRQFVSYATGRLSTVAETRLIRFADRWGIEAWKPSAASQSVAWTFESVPAQQPAVLSDPEFSYTEPIEEHPDAN